MKITSATDVGHRPYQEDQLVIQQDDAGLFVAVFDGHCGHQVSVPAAACVYDLWNEITGHPEYRLLELFKQLTSKFQQSNSGSTASIAYIPRSQNNVYCAVLGDSPIVIYDKSIGWANVSPAHNVTIHMSDRADLTEKGAFFNGPYYFSKGINKGLQLTRALGDVAFSGYIKTEPDIYTIPLANVSWILMASDGLFDPKHSPTNVYNNNIIKIINAGADASILVNYATQVPTYDNASAILINM